MTPRVKHWRCRRPGCRALNAPAKKKCESCGALRPPKRKPTHLRALDIPYEEFLALNDGKERCAICLRERSAEDKRLHRDHDHRTGQPRGLLCHKCNRSLPAWMTPEWLRAAAEYLERRTAA